MSEQTTHAHGAHAPPDGDRVLKEPEVIHITGRSSTSIWRDERAGRFPKRFNLGENSVGWLKSEVYGWLAERAGKRASAFVTSKQVAPKKDGGDDE